MGRLGFEIEQAKHFYAVLYENHQIVKPVRIMSHFACADDFDNPLNQKQIQVFKELTNKFQTEFSLCNSAGIFHCRKRKQNI